ncbi:hypothetical protein COHA_003415 [Chlorella ohadii]|uniref:Uncharacterized protein n=1 Tax=Chlorella ohadii TaxID=2649997 RepID=A0AAD5DUU7_9CHLO|nr:hypothetical protein COHA_003415 [Chlorella ohadii]
MDPAAMGQQLGAAAGAPADMQQQLGAALNVEQMMALMPGMGVLAGMAGMGGLDWSHMAVAPQMDQEVSEPAPGPRSRSGKPTRRGPMDEMRQLVRILVKLLPQSIAYIGANEEAGGGNRISEEQIKTYLEKTLGDAPRPQWGVPNGWYSYVAELFSWALGRPVDEESCKKCAKREPGRSWEAIEIELQAIGVHPHCWPLPLSQAAVREAEKNPIAQPIPQVGWLPAVKRDDGGSVRRSTRSAGGFDLDRLTEYELWKHLNDVLTHCAHKAGTTTSPPELVQQLNTYKGNAKMSIDALTTGGLNMLQYVPVMGLDGNPSMMAFLGGMQGMPMGLPPARASLLGALDPAVAAAQEAAAAAGLQQLPGYQPGAPMPMPFPGMTAGGAPPGAGGA